MQLLGGVGVVVGQRRRRGDDFRVPARLQRGPAFADHLLQGVPYIGVSRRVGRDHGSDVEKGVVRMARETAAFLRPLQRGAIEKVGRLFERILLGDRLVLHALRRRRVFLQAERFIGMGQGRYR